MTKKITKLTQAQKDRLEEWSDRWIEIGLRTGNADRAKFEVAAKKCYEYAGLSWHGRVVWVPSPIVLAISAPIASLLLELSTKKILTEISIGDEVRNEVRDAVDIAVRDEVRDAIGAVRGAIGAIGSNELQIYIRNSVLSVISRGWGNYIGGQLWPGGYWHDGGAFTSFFREICNLELESGMWERGIAYEETIQSACWWWPHKDFIMVCERPTVIKKELVNPSRTRGLGSHRLHCENGPAITWPDGWGIYAWHGVRVPREWIMEKTLTAGQAISWPQIEQRRAACEIIGWSKILKQLDAKVINKHESEYIGTLLEVNLPDSGKERFLKVLCGTGREFVIPVPREMKTAYQANAWTYGLDENLFNPEMRT